MDAPGEANCPECGAAPCQGKSCQGMFEELLAREFQNPANTEVHHLTVLCYNLQHPKSFSDKALAWSRIALKATVEQGVTQAELGRRTRQLYNSSKSKIHVKRGEKPIPVKGSRRIHWTMTVNDVVGEDATGHNERVRAWAASVLKDLKTAGLLE